MSGREVKGTIRGFTPVIDAVSDDLGITAALVFGRMWRYCQMSTGLCTASQGKIADNLGLSRQTVNKFISLLCGAGYLEDLTPTLKNRPHAYRDTGKVYLRQTTEAGLVPTVAEIDTTVAEIDTTVAEIDAKIESKREAKREEHLTPLTHDDFYEAPPREKLTLDERKGRIAAAIANNEARGEATSWAVPAQAGGSDEIGDALLPIFCDGVGVAVHALPDRRAASWRKSLREVSDRWGATVDEATSALGGLMAPDGDFSWKSYSTPFQTSFQSDFELMLGRVLSGKPLESKRGQASGRQGTTFDDGANPYGVLTPEEWDQYPLIGDEQPVGDEQPAL